MKIPRPIITTLLLLLIWQCIIMFFKLPAYILPSPLLTFHTLFQQFPLLMSQSLPTLIETLLGLMGAIILGVFTALLMAYMHSVQHWLRPILLISQALPTFAVAPLFVIWLGYGMSAKIVVVILMLYFPITSSFFDGLSQTNSQYLDLAYLMNATPWKTLTLIRIPSAMSHFATGLRVATAGAPLGAVIGEWVGASKGLGFLMLNANARMQVDLMFAALIILICWSLFLYFSIDFILKKYFSNN